MKTEPRCLHDGSLASALVSTPGGCVAFPDVEEMNLCAQHLISLPDGALDGYEIVRWYVEWPELQERFK